MKLVPINNYVEYRYKVMFWAYKWDPQVYDENTISRNVLLIDSQTAKTLAGYSEGLSRESIQMEEALLKNPSLAKGLGIPKKTLAHLRSIKGYNRDEHVRLMRFDFHPVKQGGWRISEVNSDVPAGIAEASILPRLAKKHVDSGQPYGDVSFNICKAFDQFMDFDALIALVHLTAYEEDRQVLECVGDSLFNSGYRVVYAAPNQLKWKKNKPHSLVAGNEGMLSAIVRYFPAEHFRHYPFGCDTKGFFSPKVPSCNHPIALYSQSKRLPLIWDKLGVNCTHWKTLLPETVEVTTDDPDFILKPAMGRVGEGIAIKETMTQKVFERCVKAAQERPGEWVSQRRFESLPIHDNDGTPYHLCLGAFTVNCVFAGFYARLSKIARIDDKAIDVPVLVEEE